MLPVNSHSDGYYKIHPLQGALNVVQPSIERPRYSGRNKLLRTGMNNEPSAESRIYFAQLAALANAIVNQLRPPVTVTTTITAVTTSNIFLNFSLRNYLVKFYQFFGVGAKQVFRHRHLSARAVFSLWVALRIHFRFLSAPPSDPSILPNDRRYPN
jgi:hypothetical protein